MMAPTCNGRGVAAAAVCWVARASVVYNRLRSDAQSLMIIAGAKGRCWSVPLPPLLPLATPLLDKQASKSAIPRVYVSGAQEFAGGSFIPYDASDFRFVLSADGKSLSNCYTVSSFYSSLPFFPCNTWNKLSAIEGFAWSFSGAIPGMTCVNLNEPSEASSDTWCVP